MVDFLLSPVIMFVMSIGGMIIMGLQMLLVMGIVVGITKAATFVKGLIS